MLEGKLIIIPALGHQNKAKSSFTGSGLFVLMSQCGNNNELALQHGGFCTTWSLVCKRPIGSVKKATCFLEKGRCSESGIVLWLKIYVTYPFVYYEDKLQTSITKSSYTICTISTFKRRGHSEVFNGSVLDVGFKWNLPSCWDSCKKKK